MVDVIHFMEKQLERFLHIERASRLTPNCVKGYVEAPKLTDIPVIILDVFDESTLLNSVREEL